MSTQVSVEPILAFKDNYIWCLVNSATKHCILVDPGEARPALAFLKNTHYTLDAILITHHHWDHTNGVKALLRTYSVPVYGPAKETVLGVTQPVDEGDTFHIEGWPLNFKVLATPGHTLGHIAYYAEGMLFCGDTLFSAGCGRLFEGTADQMLASLNKLAHLPGDTQLYCGHEYTLANLHFAQMIEPENSQIKERLEKVREFRQSNLPSLPNTLENERKINPFLRCEQIRIADRIEKHHGRRLTSPVEIFAYLRQWKNNYK
ncbi:hydroxyacylglutathione hydrolase [Rickettsiella massiliensis]|uniref:hydroxyacylglutathione hydrolase n=1 Tax=Rickettsiella massiliensis TaxID=676517 RepID=UPI000299FA45|nr:hydroxyacylglutathione hydrolase [Rickettsiella massiliensis]